MAMAEYIEREAFLDSIERMKPYHQDADDIAEMLQNFPAADVRLVVKARWNVGADGWECSNCTIESNNTYPICPYCGAEMEES